LQDGRCLIVVPITDDVFQKVSVSACRHLRKEIAADRFAAVRKTELDEARARALDDFRKVEQRSLQPWVTLENAGEQRAVATAQNTGPSSYQVTVTYGLTKPLGSPAPIFLLLPLHGRASRVLHLHPIR
jgi:hypothetical protein